MKIELDKYEIERLVELLEEQLDSTQTGNRTGYGQALNDEIFDIRVLRAKLKAAR